MSAYRLCKVRYLLVNIIILILMAFFTGIVSLFFAPAGYPKAIFLSYFSKPLILLLNILPVVFLILVLFFIINRIWLSFITAYSMVMVLTWINYYKLVFRDDPLLAADLVLISESVEMAGKYNIKLNWQIILAIALGILFAGIARVYARGRIKSPAVRLCALGLVVAAGISVYNHIYMSNKVYDATANNDLINRWSPTQTFISKGFLYPFIYSIKTSFPKPPEGYDPVEAKELLYSFAYTDIPEEKKVNIICVMLEAYNDFSKFKEIDFNIGVYDYLHQLREESYHGEVVTNVFAGNTINTERCFLTGYTTLYNFRKNTNSYVHYFREQGYVVEGSHPCYDWFYNRKNVNVYLGFERYYYFENYYSELAGGKIAGDDILFSHIIKLYEQNKNTGRPYFSFNVTYQNHGPYSSERKASVDYIKNKGYPEEEYNILNNYFSGIYDTNQRLKEFIGYFRAQEDPVVVILFGDHNPWLGDNNSVYKMLGINLSFSNEEGFYNYYNTPYIIWANDRAKRVLNNAFEGEGPKISPNFLMNVFFKLAGYEGNEFMKLSNELMKLTDVVHDKKYYKESGQFTAKLSEKAQKMLNDFLKVQYYWSRNFRKELTGKR